MLNQPIRLVVVDDHPAFRAGLIALLNSEPDIDVVAEGGDGRAAVEIFRRERPDVALMDLRMPGVSGVEAILAIRNEFSDARIIVLTTYDCDEDVFRAMQSGARSYLLKDATKEEIAGTIRSVHSGEPALPARLAMRLAERLRRPELTERETEVLHQLTRGRSNREIGSALFISEETVKCHLKTLFAKLGVRDRTEAAMTAIRHGIVHLG